MADYYPLIARAVAGLEKNTGEARRALYERARSALVAQLRSTKPPMSESEITKERLALEEAIRRVEADTARRVKLEAQSSAAPAAGAPASAEAGRPMRPQLAPHPQSGPEAKPQPRMKPLEPAPDGARPPSLKKAAPPNTARRPLSDEGLKGFRDVVAEAESLGEATAQASKSAREAYLAVPSDVPELDRMEPRAEPEGLRAPQHDPRIARTREAPAARPADLQAPKPREIPVAAQHGASLEAPDWSGQIFSPPPRLPPRVQAPNRDHALPTHSRKGLIAAVSAVLLILALGGGVFWQRDLVASLFNGDKAPSVQAPRDTQPTRPKITDRVGQPAAETSSTPRGLPSTEQSASVAQRVVLYEEDPAEPAGRRYVGSAVWRTESVAGPSQQPEIAVRADVEIPERRITMTLTLRRNSDQNLPASHTIEIMFNLPADFPFGGIANVPGILMKQAEATRGAPLAGLAVKVTSGFFLVGLSATESDQQRNIQLLKERGWFDIPVVYNNGRRAILAIEKGNPGDKAFADAFGAWGQGG